MKNKKRLGLILTFGLHLLLTACLARPLIVEGEMPTPVMTLAIAEPSPEPSSEPTATLAPTETADPTATPTAQPTNTPAPTNTPQPTATSQAQAHLVTQGETAVRVGPGLDYDLSHFLGPGTTAPILGRNAQGGWWAIHGPGDGPGPHAWVADGDVTVTGNSGSVPILPAPGLPPTPVGLPDVPLVGETGSPPAGRCIVAHPGQTGPINVHLGPGEQFASVARLDVNRWAETVQEQVGWYEIRLGPGEVGWVNGTAVALNEFC
jgi:uncharacterized protein YgiM (DUF1202 family)